MNILERMKNTLLAAPGLSGKAIGKMVTFL